MTDCNCGRWVALAQVHGAVYELRTPQQQDLNLFRNLAKAKQNSAHQNYMQLKAYHDNFKNTWMHSL
jgi:hypothetical protein